jgi:hypothetical protein
MVVFMGPYICLLNRTGPSFPPPAPLCPSVCLSCLSPGGWSFAGEWGDGAVVSCLPACGRTLRLNTLSCTCFRVVDIKVAGLGACRDSGTAVRGRASAGEVCKVKQVLIISFH